MEDLLTKERAAEQQVHELLKQPEEPIRSLLKAFEAYRELCQQCIFAEFQGAEKREARLWYAHTEGKKYFSRGLKNLRKQGGERPVEMRALVEFFLKFIKSSQRFYREYVHKLSTAFGIPELEAVAQAVKSDSQNGSLQNDISGELRTRVLNSCHQTLIYLGDLSRYRASEQLDKTPDYGPAIGYYGLACTLRPSSGMGHHQQAVVALEQRNHMRAIYHLYRAIVVDEPHPNAANNLKLEFDKTNAAWNKGELIQKGLPNDPNISKNALTGWFTRLHSMCYRGVPFKGYQELENEVMSRLSSELKQRTMDSTFMRMLVINLAAQHAAQARFEEEPSDPNMNSFLHFLRVNLRTYSTLLHLVYDDLVSALREPESVYCELAVKLRTVSRRILPGLRLYSSWFLLNAYVSSGAIHLDENLGEPLDELWRIYAKTLSLVTAGFPIWDLEDLEEVTYLLDEDADTVGFKPLLDDKSCKTHKIWWNQKTGVLKPHATDRGAQRVSEDVEMLARVKEFLVDGLYLANDDATAPIKLKGTKITYRDEEISSEIPIMSAMQLPDASMNADEQPAKAAVKPPKPSSWAAITANGHEQAIKAADENTKRAAAVSTKHEQKEQDAQLSRMVDDLVDDDDGNDPITPPQNASSPVVITANGDLNGQMLSNGINEFVPGSKFHYQPKAKSPKPQSKQKAQHGHAASSNDWRTPRASLNGTPQPNLQAVWNSPAPDSGFPSGLPVGTLGSPAQVAGRCAHSRVNSANSIRSRTSQNVANSRPPLEAASRTPAQKAGLIDDARFANRFDALSAFDPGSNVASPLLFGAGESMWSTGPRRSFGSASPPSGQGG